MIMKLGLLFFLYVSSKKWEISNGSWSFGWFVEPNATVYSLFKGLFNNFVYANLLSSKFTQFVICSLARNGRGFFLSNQEYAPQAFKPSHMERPQPLHPWWHSEIACWIIRGSGMIIERLSPSQCIQHTSSIAKGLARSCDEASSNNLNPTPKPTTKRLNKLKLSHYQTVYKYFWTLYFVISYLFNPQNSRWWLLIPMFPFPHFPNNFSPPKNLFHAYIKIGMIMYPLKGCLAAMVVVIDKKITPFSYFTKRE